MTDSSRSQGWLLQNCQSGKRFSTKFISTILFFFSTWWLQSYQSGKYGKSWISLFYSYFTINAAIKKRGLNHFLKLVSQGLPHPLPSPIVFSVELYQMVDKRARCCCCCCCINSTEESLFSAQVGSHSLMKCQSHTIHRFSAQHATKPGNNCDGNTFIQWRCGTFLEWRVKLPFYKGLAWSWIAGKWGGTETGKAMQNY